MVGGPVVCRGVLAGRIVAAADMAALLAQAQMNPVVFAGLLALVATLARRLGRGEITPEVVTSAHGARNLIVGASLCAGRWSSVVESIGDLVHNRGDEQGHRSAEGDSRGRV